MKNLILIQDLGLFNTSANRKVRYGLYKCFCGNEFKTSTYSVNSYQTKSCGCIRSEKLAIRNTSHNKSKHILYETWNNMMMRCYNKNNKHYSYYGEIGIDVCDRWHRVELFIEDMHLGYKDGLSIDRIDNLKGYSKDNCRWATKKEQSLNRKIFKNNTSGYRGVTWHKRDNKWQSSIRINGKSIHLGYFNTAIEGAKAYNEYVIANNLYNILNTIEG